MELAATHFGLTIDPPVVPPGGTLVLRYRAVNHGAAPSPPATVTFAIDPAAVDAVPEAIDLGVLAPGDVREVSATVRLTPLVRNGSALHIQAVLVAGDAAPLGSNIVVVDVRGRAVLAAAPSRVVLQAAGPAAWTLEATVANTGDAPSDETRLVIELPPGVCAAHGASRIDRPIAALEPGAATSISASLTLDGIPPLPLQILDAALVAADGRRVALPPSEPAFPPVEPPIVTLALARTGRRIDTCITIENPNAGALTDLVLEAAWPRALRLADGSLLVDGCTPLRAGARSAASTLKTSAGGATIALARLAPRSTTTIAACSFAAATTGEVTLLLRSSAGDAAARAAIPPGPARGHALVLAPAIAAVIAGSDATLTAMLIGGDDACSISVHGDDDALRFSLDGAPLAAGTEIALAAGTRRDMQIVVPVDAACADGTRIERRVRATSDRGAVAEAGVAVIVRSRAWLEIAEWLAPCDGGARVAIANVGSTPADGVRLEAADGSRLALGSIAPAQTVAALLDAHAAVAFGAGAMLVRDGAEPQTIAPLRRPPAAPLAIAFDLPHDVHEGIAFDLRATIVIPAGAHALTVRCVEHDGLAVVPGSTSIDDHAIVDGATPRIAAGIALHGVPAGATIALAMRCLARNSGPIDVAIGTAIDGGEERIDGGIVYAAARAAFPQKPDTLRYYLDAPAIAGSAAPVAAIAQSEPEPPAALDDGRRAQLARAVQRRMDDPIADALGVLAALMPAGEPRDAFAENAERLGVKIRIPGYLADADDYESVAARDALDRARGEAGIGPLAAARGSVAALAAWCATIDPAIVPGLPVAAYVRAFVQFASECAPADRAALETARDDLRTALTVAA